MQNKFNVLLDPLPTDWEGYPIDSDFQTGIQLYWVLDDKSLTQNEKMRTCASFLFTEEIPKSQAEIAEAVKWFLSAWNNDNTGAATESKKPVMDFQSDQWRIWVAFKNQYGIDLNRDQVHFWAFMQLLRNLEECSFTRVMDIRGRKPDAKTSTKERKALAQAQAIFAITNDDLPPEEKYTPEELAKIEEFDRKREAMLKAKQAFEEAKS